MLGYDYCGASGLFEIDLWASQVWRKVLSYEGEEDGAALRGVVSLFVMKLWAHWVSLFVFLLLGVWGLCEGWACYDNKSSFV